MARRADPSGGDRAYRAHVVPARVAGVRRAPFPSELVGELLERHLVRVRRELERAALAGRGSLAGLYVPSLSASTIVYKGMLVAGQLARFYPDPLADPELRSAIAAFHQRFSTNTFPSWERAQPDAHARPQR